MTEPRFFVRKIDGERSDEFNVCDTLRPVILRGKQYGINEDKYLTDCDGAVIYHEVCLSYSENDANGICALLNWAHGHADVA